MLGDFIFFKLHLVTFIVFTFYVVSEFAQSAIGFSGFLVHQERVNNSLSIIDPV